MANNTIAVLRQMLASLDDAKKYQSLRDVMSTMNAPDLAAVFEDTRRFTEQPLRFFAVQDVEQQAGVLRGIGNSESFGEDIADAIFSLNSVRFS